MNWLRRLLQRLFPASRAETRRKYETLELRLAELQNSLRERDEAMLAALAERDREAKEEAASLRAALETQRQWAEATFAAQEQGRDVALETQRERQEAFVRDELETYRRWAEAALAAQERSRDVALETQRQWQEAFVRGELEDYRRWEEAAMVAHQTWASDMTKGENYGVLQKEDQIKSMLESLWKEQRAALPGGVALPAVLEAKAYMDATERAVEQSLEELRQYAETVTKPLVVFCGDYVVFPNEGPRRFIDDLAALHPENDFLLLSEVSWFTPEETAEKIHIPFHIVPHAIGARYHAETIDIPLSEEELALIENTEALWEASMKARKHNPEVTENFAKYTVLTAYRYYSRVFQILVANRVFIFNNSFYLHQVVDHVVRAAGIRACCWEFGGIPGTLMMDEKGVLGEQYPARQYEQFRKLPVSAEEIRYASEVLIFLKSGRLNRHAEMRSAGVEELLRELKQRGRSVILFAGHYELNSGNYPYTERSKEIFAPVFSSGDKAVGFIGEMARRNGWEVIYKLHPLDNVSGHGLPDNVYVLKEGNIRELVDFADVTITISSGVSYIAMIRGKPAVILGYMDLRGKGCAYEAYELERVEPVIREALANGMTEHMKEMFAQHVARMNKYYWYDDNQPRELRYGRKIEQLEL